MRIRILLDVTLLVLKNRLLLKWSQCKHSKKGTVRRDWNDVDNRNGRDVLEKRQRRETEGAVFETRGTGKEDGLDVLRDVLLRLRSLSAYVHVYIRSRSPPNVQHFTSYNYMTNIALYIDRPDTAYRSKCST